MDFDLIYIFNFLCHVFILFFSHVLFSDRWAEMVPFVCLLHNTAKKDEDKTPFEVNYCRNKFICKQALCVFIFNLYSVPFVYLKHLIFSECLVAVRFHEIKTQCQHRHGLRLTIDVPPQSTKQGIEFL